MTSAEIDQVTRVIHADLILDRLAYYLNECQRLGLEPRCRHGSVLTTHGYILQDEDGWHLRTLISAPPPD